MSDHMVRFNRAICWVIVASILLAIFSLQSPAPPVQAQTPGLLDEVMFVSPTLDNNNQVAWGDADGDGDLDLAVSSWSGDNQLYRNDGHGNFAVENMTPGAPANYTNGLAWGDADGDGDLDLAVAYHGYTDTVKVNRLYRNDGKGYFAVENISADNRYTTDVVWGDMDGDGDLDIVVGNSALDRNPGVGQPNQLYRNDGQGHFTIEALEPEGQGRFTYQVAVGDIDNDGDLDIVAGNYNALNVLYLNDGLGHFSRQDIGSAVRNTTAVALGDADGDGDLDLAVGNNYEKNQLYLNDGRGYLTGQDINTLKEGAVKSLAWGDVDGDGDLDLAIGRLYVNELGLNNGKGQFTSQDIGTSAGDTFWVAWGDADGDGDLDLAVANLGMQTSGITQIHRNNSVDFPIQNLSVGRYTMSVAWGDADGDGDLDLAVGNGEPTATLTTTTEISFTNQLYRNDGRGNFAFEDVGGPPRRTLSVAWGDADGDGDLDLAVGNYGEPNQLYRNDGSGHFTIEDMDALTENTRSVAWGDADGDGDLDLAVGNERVWVTGDIYRGGYNQLYRNDGSGHFTVENIEADPRFTFAIAWGDADGDGDLDLAIGNSAKLGSSDNYLYLNDGSGHFVPVQIGGEPMYTRSLAWGDADGDGALDLAVGNLGQRSELYRNDGLGHFATEIINSTPYNTVSVAWADADGDGDLDLALGNGDPRTHTYDYSQLAVNDGQGSFVIRNLTAGIPQPYCTLSVAWGDADGDGDPDLAAGNNYRYFSHPNQIYLNRRAQGVDNRAPVLKLFPPYATDVASFYAVPDILDGVTIPITYTLFDREGDPVGGVAALYSPDGGGRWLPAVAASGTVTTHLAVGYQAHSGQVYSPTLSIPNGTGSPLTATLTLTDAQTVADVEVWLSITHTANADLSAALVSPQGTTVLLFGPGVLSGSHLQGSDFDDQAALSIVSATPPYTRSYRPQGSLAALNGEPINGIWTMIVTDTQANGSSGVLAAWGLRVSTPAVEHVYIWDTFASGLFGQSDNVVLRLEAWSVGEGSAAPTTYRYPRSSHAFFQLTRATATTSPFRVRGTQVRVYRESVAPGHEAAAAMVYRLPAGQMQGGQPLADGSGWPFRTDTQGYLQGRGRVGIGDRLFAMLPVSTTTRYAGTLSLDGVDNRVFTRLNINQSPDTPGATMMAWVYPTKSENRKYQVFSTNDGYSDWSIMHQNGKWYVYTGAEEKNTTVSVDLHQWQHIAAVFDPAGGSKFYKNGQLVYSTAQIDYDTSDADLRIGYSLIYGEQFAGQLDELRIYERPLSVSEIQQAMNLSVKGSVTGLLAYWNLDQADIDHTRVCRDQSGNGYDAVLIGATWAGAYLGGYTVYHTSGIPTEDGVNTFSVAGTGIQAIAVTAQHPLILFDLNVSLEWDASHEPAYLDQLTFNLQRVSQYLYDFTNGQMALGNLHVMQDGEGWGLSHILVRANNRLRPFAAQGGIVITDTVDPQHPDIVYGPGQVVMGSTWNRYGRPGQSLGEDWPIILAHELGHYLLYQDDTYLGLDAQGNLIPIDTCLGSAMGDLYNDPNATEFIFDETYWQANCRDTLAEKTLGRNEWETLRLWYGDLATPATIMAGPNRLPFQWAAVRVWPPLLPTAALADPTFYLINMATSSSEARAFALRSGTVITQDQVIDLGSPLSGQNRVVAHGIQPGDRLCVFDRPVGQYGCEVVAAGDDQLWMEQDLTWNPTVQLTPVNSTTFNLQVTGIPAGLSVWARMYPELEDSTLPVNLVANGTAYSGTLRLAGPTIKGHVQVWVNETATEENPRRETMVAFSVGGNPGNLRPGGIGNLRPGGIGNLRPGGIGNLRPGGIGNLRPGGGNLRPGGAPVVSPDGQMILYTSGAVTFEAGQFYVIQSMAGLPALPPGRMAVGQGYRLMASPGTPPMDGSVSIQYLANDLLTAGVAAQDLAIYYHDGAAWRELSTRRDAYFNLVSAPSQGPGLYALLASIQVRLTTPGWNLIAYPLRDPQPVDTALRSIDGFYTTVYGYQAADTADPWKLYQVGGPGYLNDLIELEFGRGYWVRATQAITIYISGATAELPAAMGLPASPPDTYYGLVQGNEAFVPVAGMGVEARIGSTVCGRGTVREYGGQWVYVVHVEADDGTGRYPGCGQIGRGITFYVDGQEMSPAATWRQEQPHEFNLSPAGWQIYLPIVIKGK